MSLNLSTAEKILLVAPHRLGDSIFATPGIRALRQAKPTAQIDVVALSSLSYELFQNNHCVNHIFLADDYPIDQLATQYDIILPLQNIQKTQDYVNKTPNVLILPRYTGDVHYSENFYRFVVQQLPTASQFVIGPYEINITNADMAHSQQLLKSIPPIPKPFILAIHMGCHRIAKEGQHFLYKLFPFLATKESRSWPFQRFNQLIQQLLKAYPQAYIVLTGSPNERYAAKSLTAHPHIINLMGSVNVNQLAALLTQCDLLLTGDTGPMHVACAVETPIVLLCGETDPAETGPYPKRESNIIIHTNGMEAISVAEVYQAVVGWIP